jgi:anti-sigma factor RsiW
VTGPTCDHVRELAPEFALSLLDGTERAEVIEHLDECDECRSLVSDFREAVDALADAVPEADPAPGFVHRALNRIDSKPVARTPHPPRRNRPVLAWLGAAAAAAAIVFGLVFTGGGHSAVAMRTGSLVDASGTARGDAYLAGGSHPWMFMRVQLSAGAYAPTTSYSCELVLDDGHTVVLGTFTAQSGAGEWGHSVDVAVDHVVAARLRGSGGELLAEAKLH